MSNYKLLLVVCLSIISFEVFAQLSVLADRVSCRYEVGEQASFNITSSTSGTATYRIGYDAISQPLETGTINIQSGATVSIPFTAFDPAHVICEVTQNGNVQKAGANFSCFDIDPIAAPPSDFKSFWNSQIAASNGIPLNPTLVPHSSTNLSTTYKLYFSNIDGRGVSGFISIPNGSGNYPCVVTLPPYGDDPNIVVPEIAFAEWSNAISVSIAIHNTFDVTQTDPNAYFPDQIDDRNNIYYRYAIMAAIRAIDYVATRPDFDQTNVAAYGVSQGGGLAILLAGIDDRVNVLINSSPTLCQHDGLHVEKASGFPYYVNRSRGQFGTSAHEDATVYATSYYDAVHAASFFDGHTLMGASYLDEIAPAGSIFPAYNNIKGKNKTMIHSSRVAHANSDEFWADKFKILRMAWPEATANPPFQFIDSGLGYMVEAGDDISTSNNSVALSAVVSTDDGVNNSFPVKWEMVSGPGNVSFTNQFGRNTNVSFSTAGTYVLKVRAEDATSLAYKDIFYSIEDFITITAGGGGTTQQNQTINFPAIADKVTSDSPFNIFASATSGLNVTLTVISGPASITGNTILLTGQTGTVTVRAEQPGNSDWFAANSVIQTFNVTAPSAGDCSSTSNIGLNKTATQSSTQLGASASRAVDGNTNGNFWSSNSVTYTNWEGTPWLQVDLGSPHNIEAINVWNRTDCCQSDLTDYHVFISNTPFTSTNLLNTINQNGVTNIVQNSTAGSPTNLPANVSGRYIRIQLANSGILAIAELEIIGCTDEPTGCTTVGNPCNDGNACTTNDVIDANCNCLGTFADSDNDGVCDANDICPGGDDNIDTDNDGTPDFCDGCSTTGQACNDGNSCTINDVINAACNCVGTYVDSDNDGVCDANDICPGGDDNIDSDNDGTPDFCDGCSTSGQPCNDGNSCTINDVINAACNCVGTYVDSDNDGVCDANDICPGGDDNVDSDNDGIPDFCDSPTPGPCATSIDGYTFIGTHNGHNYFRSNTEETFPTAQASAEANGGYVVTINDAAENEFIKSNISDLTFIGLNDAENEGDLVWANGDPFIYDNIDLCTFCASNTSSNDYVIMTFWDGMWSFSNQWASRGYIIEIDCDGGGGGETCTTTGQACNDNDDCTSGDVIDANCNCIGVYQDSDNDGICNSEDICPGSNDNIDTDGDGTPDGCDDTPNGGGGGGSGNGCTSTTNIAVNKPATQSGTQLGSVASRANDGVTSGDYWVTNSVSNTDWINNPWWEVDLGAIYNIEEINIWNRTDCCEASFANYHVLISNTPFTSTNLNTTLNQAGVTDLFQSSVAATPTSIENNGTGRYVRIQLADQGALVIAEVEIFGCPSTGSCPDDGTPCNDANELTVNDVEDGNCNCAGTLQQTLNYCGSNGNSTAYEHIESFNVGNINNNSGSNNGYQDFTSQSTSLSKGNYFTFNMTPGFSGNASNVWWTIWIDLNGDGDFYDPNEEVFKAVSSSYRSGSAYISNNSITGNTRMRIAMSANGYTGPCQVFPYGEVEDYNVNITPNVAPLVSNELEETLDDKVVLMPNPVEDLLVVELFDNFLEFENMTIQVHNAQGLLMAELNYSELPYGSKFLIETDNFKAGYYLLSIKKDTITTVKPFIKMRN